MDIYTREQYMQASRGIDDKRERDRVGREAHQRYFGQFVTQATIDRVVSKIGADALLASRDPHLNDIPLRLWDKLVPQLPGSSGFRKAGDYYTVGNGVCLAKEAARQWIESQRA